MARKIKLTRLEFVRGKSAKQYSVWLSPKGKAFEVWAAWGRISDKTPTNACKSKKPLDRPAAEALAARLLEAKRRKGYAEVGGRTPRIGRADVRSRKAGAEATRKRVRQGSAPKPDAWSLRFAELKTRKVIASLAEKAFQLEGLALDAKAAPASFASWLVGYSSSCRQFIPPELVLDEAAVKDRERMLATHEKRCRAKKDGTAPYHSLAKDVVATIVALMSKGVKRLNWAYAGGWDDISVISEGPEIEFLVRPKGGKKGAAKAGRQLLAWLRKMNPELDINDVLMCLLDDTGAGPPEYSQNFSVDLETGKLREYGWKEDEDEDSGSGTHDPWDF